MSTPVSLRRLLGTGNRLLLFLALAAALNKSVLAADTQLRSTWDNELLNMEFPNVSIDGSSLNDSWMKLCHNLALRSVIYWDTNSDSDSKNFVFKSDAATGREILEAFLFAYPAYTFTQDPATGVIWIHRKAINYEDILSQKVQIKRSVQQVPVYSSVIIPLRAFFPKHALPSDQGILIYAFSYGVDLSAGVYSIRDVLNLCLVENPHLILYSRHFSNGDPSIGFSNLMNPKDTSRTAPAKFWHGVMGDGKSGVPSIEEVGAALSDANPRKRWAACVYLRMESDSLQQRGRYWKLFSSIDSDPQKAVWEALAGATIVGGVNYGHLERLQQFVTNDLPQLNPGLALLACMQLAMQKNDPGIMDPVVGHKFSIAETDAIKPEFYRLFWESKLVRDKLLQMKFDAPELSPQSLNELGNIIHIEWPYGAGPPTGYDYRELGNTDLFAPVTAGDK